MVVKNNEIYIKLLSLIQLSRIYNLLYLTIFLLLLKGGPTEMVGSDIDYQYEGAPDPNDARFDRGTYPERQMPAMSALKQSNMERMSTYTSDSNRAKPIL